MNGAHVALVFNLKRHKKHLKGFHKADSIVMDAHKLIRTPTLCAILLVKKAKNLDQVFEQKASYLFHEKKQPGFDFIQQAVECTKAGLELKFYFSLAAMREESIEEYLDNTFALTQQAYEYIDSLPDFECPYMPESNILCFKPHASDLQILAIRDRLIEEG